MAIKYLFLTCKGKCLTARIIPNGFTNDTKLTQLWNLWEWNKIQGLSVQSLNGVWLCDPMDYSTPGFPVHHQLLELAQTHVHRVGDGIQPSYPLLSPFPPTFNLSQNLGLFQWVSSLHQVVKVLEFQLQYQSSNEYSGLISLRLTGLISLQSKRLSRVFSNTTDQKH